MCVGTNLAFADVNIRSLFDFPFERLTSLPVRKV